MGDEPSRNLSPSDHDLLIRIDERTRLFHEKVNDRVTKIEKTMVTQKEFGLVKKMVYGAATLIGTTVILAILGTIISD